MKRIEIELTLDDLIYITDMASEDYLFFLLFYFISRFNHRLVCAVFKNDALNLLTN